MFGRKKEQKKAAFDPARQKPVLRCSICNGEQVAGFKDLETGAFTELKLIRSPQELQELCELYGVTEFVKEY
ncbi:MAG: aspartate dehydrogenase [Lachnospiraceae bacterium]|nr:aspartate dehydrogenase [Lachnospiraceae bacterium]MBQ9642667.1 aspartate dehydrogenase [Lachnospiraceae bacterium]